MTKLTREELETKGLVVNPNMPLFGGWFYCRICERYSHHYAMSHKGESDCFEICRDCNCYSGRRIVEG